MVNGREGTDNDLLSFFVFMPRDDKSLIVPSKLEIKEYKKHYADFPFKLNSYLEKNNVLLSSEILHTDDNVSDEEEVLEETTKQLKDKMQKLIAEKKISDKSKVMYVNDGSKDKTWDIIEKILKM